MLLRKFYTKYHHWNDTKPLMTKCVTAGVLFGLGDLLCQNLEKSKYPRKLTQSLLCLTHAFALLFRIWRQRKNRL